MSVQLTEKHIDVLRMLGRKTFKHRMEKMTVMSYNFINNGSSGYRFKSGDLLNNRNCSKDEIKIMFLRDILAFHQYFNTKEYKCKVTLFFVKRCDDRKYKQTSVEAEWVDSSKIYVGNDLSGMDLSVFFKNADHINKKIEESVFLFAVVETVNSFIKGQNIYFAYGESDSLYTSVKEVCDEFGIFPISLESKTSEIIVNDSKEE